MTFLITFLEGIITFVSPCLLPMIPIYVTYFAAGEEVRFQLGDVQTQTRLVRLNQRLHEAVRLAEAFVRECAIQTMPQNIPAREGVDFEPILWKLHEGL